MSRAASWTRSARNPSSAAARPPPRRRISRPTASRRQIIRYAFRRPPASSPASASPAAQGRHLRLPVAAGRRQALPDALLDRAETAVRPPGGGSWPTRPGSAEPPRRPVLPEPPGPSRGRPAESRAPWSPWRWRGGPGRGPHLVVASPRRADRPGGRPPGVPGPADPRPRGARPAFMPCTASPSAPATLVRIRKTPGRAGGEALNALRVAEKTGQPVAHWSELGVYRYLVGLPHHELAELAGRRPRSRRNWRRRWRPTWTERATSSGRRRNWASTARRSTTASARPPSSPARTCRTARTACCSTCHSKARRL